jgi:hypothetical protein
VAEREQELQGKEEEVTGTLEHGRMELSSHEAGLNAREATLEEEQRRMGELHAILLARELDTDLQASRRKELEDRERELADKEKRLAEKQLQELATIRKSLQELQAVRMAGALKVWDFLGQTEIAL